MEQLWSFRDKTCTAWPSLRLDCLVMLQVQFPDRGRETTYQAQASTSKGTRGLVQTTEGRAARLAVSISSSSMRLTVFSPLSVVKIDVPCKTFGVQKTLALALGGHNGRWFPLLVNNAHRQTRKLESGEDGA